jgi:TonB family protein
MMRAEIQVSDAKGTLVNGSYTLNWVSPSRWREEIRFGNYERLRVGEANGYWQRSGLNYQPEVVFELDRLLHVRDVLRVASKQTLGKIKNREKDGIRQKCTEVKWITQVDRVICFDEAGGNLLSVEYPRGQNQSPPVMSRIEYSAFNTIDGKRVPYEIRALRDKKPTAAVKILEIVKTNEENAAQFEKLENAEFWPHCDDMQEVESVSRIQPVYPMSARTNREQGRVILYAVIEADGSLSHLTVIQRATPTLESAAVEAVRHWRYKPASCGQLPIRIETSIETDFWLQY